MFSPTYWNVVFCVGCMRALVCFNLNVLHIFMLYYSGRYCSAALYSCVNVKLILCVMFAVNNKQFCYTLFSSRGSTFAPDFGLAPQM